MNSSQYHFINGAWDRPLPSQDKSQLVLVFGNRNSMQDASFVDALIQAFPSGQIVGCTTSGEIKQIHIFDDSVVVTAIHFDATPVEAVSANLTDFDNLEEATRHLAQSLPHDDLKHVLVFSDGQQVNGTTLVDGLCKHLPKNVLVSGGLAGDSDRFEETVVWHNDKAEAGKIVICGLYGSAIQIGHGSLGGWDTFGPDRLITRAKDNVLYELDNQSALELYKKYLGEFAEQLPASALRFPLSVRKEGESGSTVRTILNIDEDSQSLVFAGDMPEGHYAKLMRANFDRLIDGAQDAAIQSLVKIKDSKPQLALLISCVGRRLVLQQETDLELESIQDVLSESCTLCGFYSYGEISPMVNSDACALHNQTMTITTFSEKA